MDIQLCYIDGSTLLSATPIGANKMKQQRILQVYVDKIPINHNIHIVGLCF